MNNIKVFRINGVEWWAGKSLEECIEAACKTYDLPKEDVVDEPAELSQAELEDTIILADVKDFNSYTMTFASRIKLLLASIPEDEFPMQFHYLET